MAAHLLRKLSDRAPMWLMRFLGNLWFPFLGAGIRIVEGTEDFRYIKVCLKRSWYNTNYVGTQFGGSIYAMTDPFYMLMLLNNLGRDFIVWDKAAHIEFIKPGKFKLFAEFRLSEQQIQKIRSEAIAQGKLIFDLPVDIHDSEGTLIARVQKTLYVRRK